MIPKHNISPKLFQPFIASSLVLALGVNVGLAQPQLTVNTQEGVDQTTNAGLKWNATAGRNGWAAAQTK